MQHVEVCSDPPLPRTGLLFIEKVRATRDGVCTSTDVCTRMFWLGSPPDDEHMHRCSSPEVVSLNKNIRWSSFATHVAPCVEYGRSIFVLATRFISCVQAGLLVVCSSFIRENNIRHTKHRAEGFTGGQQKTLLHVRGLLHNL